MEQIIGDSDRIRQVVTDIIEHPRRPENLVAGMIVAYPVKQLQNV